MDQLVKQVSEKTGLPEPQARQAVETVLGFLKQKLPAPLASQVDGILEGKDEGGAGGIMGQLGGMLGG